MDSEPRRSANRSGQGEPGDQVALPLELAVRQVDAVEREDGPDHGVSRPGQQVGEREVIAAADERLAGRPAAQRLRGKCLLHQGRDQLVGESAARARQDAISSAPISGCERWTAARRMCLTGSVLAWRITLSRNRSTELTRKLLTVMSSSPTR